MTIYIGADHGGFAVKDVVKKLLKEEGYEVVDVGNSVYDKGDDFPDFGKAVAQKVSEDPTGARGILLCRSGVGMDIVANKFKNVRSVLGLSPDHVARSRHDEDSNVLSVANEFTSEEDLLRMIKAFLSTPFATEERYSRRLKKISDIENGN